MTNLTKIVSLLLSLSDYLLADRTGEGNKGKEWRCIDGKVRLGRAGGGEGSLNFGYIA